MVKIQRHGSSLTEAFVPSSSQEGPNSGWDWLDEAQGTSPIGWIRLARLLERAVCGWKTLFLLIMDLYQELLPDFIGAWLEQDTFQVNLGFSVPLPGRHSDTTREGTVPSLTCCLEWKLLASRALYWRWDMEAILPRTDSTRSQRTA